MSAFMCSDDHLRVIAIVATYRHSAYRHSGAVDLAAANDAIKDLWNANCASLRERYGARAGEHFPAIETVPPSVSTVDFTRLDRARSLAPVTVIKLTQSFEYQACEARTWPESEGYRVTQAALANAIRRLPGYDDAPWALEHERVATNGEVAIELARLASEVELCTDPHAGELAAELRRLHGLLNERPGDVDGAAIFAPLQAEVTALLNHEAARAHDL